MKPHYAILTKKDLIRAMRIKDERIALQDQLIAQLQVRLAEARQAREFFHGKVSLKQK